MANKRLLDLADEQIQLCRERGLSGEEIFIIGATTNDIDAIEKFGEEEAFRIANEAIRKSKNSDEVFRNVFEALDVQDEIIEIESD